MNVVAGTDELCKSCSFLGPPVDGLLQIIVCHLVDVPQIIIIGNDIVLNIGAAEIILRVPLINLLEAVVMIVILVPFIQAHREALILRFAIEEFDDDWTFTDLAHDKIVAIFLAQLGGVAERLQYLDDVAGIAWLVMLGRYRPAAVEALSMATARAMLKPAFIVLSSTLSHNGYVYFVTEG